MTPSTPGSGTNRQRLFAAIDGSFAVFLIGMRINVPWKVHKWWPVARTMPRLLKELKERPELGMLSGELWGGRTTILVQYWRSVEKLFAYARDSDAAHLPAWREFNRAVGIGGDVGVWHETYVVSPGAYENIYINMPPFGLGKAGTLAQAAGGMEAAAARLRARGEHP